MADEKLRKLVRAFEAGDEDAGARLAREMLRARDLLTLVGLLTPELQTALGAQTVAETLKAEIAQAVAEGIDIDDIAGTVAGQIDLNDLANEINLSDLVSEIDTDDIAQNIDVSDFDWGEIARNIDMEELAQGFDLEDLATRIAAKLEDRLQEMVEEAVG